MKYPELIFDWALHRELAENIWNAQKSGKGKPGHPKVLTYNGPDLTIRKAQRSEAMHYEVDGDRYKIPNELSRDEYPFACTVEGGKGVWVGHIPPMQNSVQGGMIAAFLRKHNIVAGMGERSKFRVRVINRPKEKNE